MNFKEFFSREWFLFATHKKLFFSLPLIVFIIQCAPIFVHETIEYELGEDFFKKCESQWENLRHKILSGKKELDYRLEYDASVTVFLKNLNPNFSSDQLLSYFKSQEWTFIQSYLQKDFTFVYQRIFNTLITTWSAFIIPLIVLPWWISSFERDLRESFYSTSTSAKTLVSALFAKILAKSLPFAFLQILSLWVLLEYFSSISGHPEYFNLLNPQWWFNSILLSLFLNILSGLISWRICLVGQKPQGGAYFALSVNTLFLGGLAWLYVFSTERTAVSMTLVFIALVSIPLLVYYLSRQILKRQKRLADRQRTT